MTKCPFGSARAAPPQGASGSSDRFGAPREGAGPVGAQPLPRVLERTATDFTAFGHAGMVVQETDRRESEVAEEVWEADGAVATGDAAEADGSDATPRGVEWSEYTALHSFEGQQGEVSQHGQSAPLAVPRPQLGSCASAGRAWRLWAARHSRVRPSHCLDAQASRLPSRRMHRLGLLRSR